MIRVSEIFGPTIQGEGALIGEPTVFVRTGGCDYRCSWCDSLHAVDSEFRHTWQAMDTEAVWQKIEDLSGGEPLLVSLSGGNPATQPLGDLILTGKAHGYRFALETQGSVSQEWFSELHTLVLSPKPPSSGERPDWKKLDQCIAQAGEDTNIVIKLVVFDDTDYEWCRELVRRYDKFPIYLQPGNHTPPDPNVNDPEVDISGINDRTNWLIDRVISDKWYKVRVLPQLHVLLWGNERGV